jgi:hypothetical protein
MAQPLPSDFDSALAQAKAALTRALDDGCSRLQIEIQSARRSVVAMARPVLTALPEPLTVVFGTGTADLAFSTWGEVPFNLLNISERQLIGNGWRAIALLDASSIDVDEVEQYAGRAGTRPFLMINNWPEKPGTLGIGRGAEARRRRFAETIEVVYYLQSYRYTDCVLRRAYPGPWEVWERKSDGYALAREFDVRPTAAQLTAFGPKVLNPLGAVERFFRGPRFYQGWT